MTTHNKSVRSALTSEGIYPENLPPEEDIKKIERKVSKRLNAPLVSDK
jgi:DNA-damage-inducible protein D